MNARIRSVVSTAAAKIGLGLCYGIGFGLSAGLILQYINTTYMLSMWDGRAAEALKITTHRKVERHGDVVVLGSLQNTTDEAISTQYIQVDLLDETGALVDQCRGTHMGATAPKAVRSFKVSCGGKPEEPTAAHDSYKVYVVGM